MKTKKFIKEIKSMGFRAKDFEKLIIIVDSNDLFVAKVSKVSWGKISTDYPGFTNLDYVSKLKLLYLLLKYTKTPIEDREEEEKYYLRQMGIGSWSFLNFNINSQEYGIAGKRDDYTYKTQFTQSEIDEMPECYTHPAVWEQVRVEEQDNV